ncbi:MAG: RdgB/HAM1 family non-canonical purine NTP pyrophosphatase [Dehalococcoidia bacterium]
MPELLIATNNPGKVAEFQRLLGDCGWKLMTAGALGIELSPEEPGETYAENARLKALEGARLSGLVTLADDSGLEIEALEGAPGPRSARFLGEDAGFDERFARILADMEGLESARRWARFRCLIAIALPDSEDARLCEGEVGGMIALEPRGGGGFGYDPLFYLPQRAATMAELPERVKDIVSHRGQAAMQARWLLMQMLYERKGADDDAA